MTEDRANYPDGEPLADRETLSEALSHITGQEHNHEDLTELLRTVTGWNKRSCARFASKALVMDTRRRDILVEMLTQHQDQMESFKKWLREL